MCWSINVESFSFAALTARVGESPLQGTGRIFCCTNPHMTQKTSKLEAIRSFVAEQQRRREDFTNREYTDWDQALKDLESEYLDRLNVGAKDEADQEGLRWGVSAFLWSIARFVRDEPPTFERFELVREALKASEWISRSLLAIESSKTTKLISETFLDTLKSGQDTQEELINIFKAKIKNLEGAQHKRIGTLKREYQRYQQHATKFIGRQLSNDKRDMYREIAKALAENRRQRKPKRESEVIVTLIRRDKTIFPPDTDPTKLRKSFDLYVYRHPRFLSSVR